MKNSKILIFIGIIFISLSLFFEVKNTLEENKASRNASIMLNELTEVIEDNKDNKVTPMVYSTIRGYDCFGVITIPSLGIELPILNTWDYERLDIGPCIYYGNINENNLVICGHSYKSHFKYLYNLDMDDYVIITDVNNNQYVYQVKDMNVISPKDTDEVIENDFDLTLFTCYNSGSQRIVIHLNKVN